MNPGSGRGNAALFGFVRIVVLYIKKCKIPNPLCKLQVSILYTRNRTSVLGSVSFRNQPYTSLGIGKIVENPAKRTAGIPEGVLLYAER